MDKLFASMNLVVAGTKEPMRYPTHVVVVSNDVNPKNLQARTRIVLSALPRQLPCPMFRKNDMKSSVKDDPVT